MAISKIYKFTILTILISVVIIFMSLELYLRACGLPKMIKFCIEPRHLLSPDSIAGWRLNSGLYHIFVQDSAIQIITTINNERNRITCAASDSSMYSGLPVLQLYGCSCTFGLSVPDSLTQAYLLQKRLPGFKVENKGVPGYGLAQMYLLLQESVTAGDTPMIAVFNYADFHDFRVPLSKNWSNTVWWCFTQGDGSGYENLSLPYYTYSNGAPTLHRTSFNKLSRFWPLSKQSAVVFILNLLYNNRIDDNLQAELHSTAHSTALDIMKFCDANHIIPVFASIVNSSDDKQTTDIQNDLNSRGYFTLDYGIDFAENRYHCGPDNGHPNALAHGIYAEKLYQLIIAKGLDKHLNTTQVK